MSILVSLAVVLSEILFVICPEPGSIIAYDITQFPYINCYVAVCNSILHVSGSL